MMNFHNITAALLSVCLLSAAATPLTAQQSATPPAADTAQVGTEFIEILYQGETIRVPITTGSSGEISLGDRWKLRLAPAGDHAPAASTPATAAGEAPPAISSSNMLLLVLAGGGLLCVLAYFLVISPMIRRRPLVAALKIIGQDLRPEFAKAEDLLEQALLKGLRKKDIAQARFAIAYLRSMMGKYEEAATALAELEKSGQAIDRPAAYLMLWVRSRLKQHERVERIYSEYQQLLAGYQQAELIVSISYLALARLRWARREINGAMHYFDLVRQLEVLASEVPSHIDDHEVVLGTVALFEKNQDEAQKHFQAAIDAAAKQGKPTFGGRLGLALCRWQSEDPADVDRALTEILAEMQAASAQADAVIATECTHCGKSYQARASALQRKVKCKACRRHFIVQIAEHVPQPEADGQQHDLEPILSDEAALLRNTRLWHCIVLISRWLTLPPRSGLPRGQRAELERRLQQVIVLDAEMGDPYLIRGLIGYYFATNHQEQQQARALIEKAVHLAVHVPEVIQLLDRENKLAQLSEYSLTYFHQLSQEYAQNPEVEAQLRERFIRTMSRYRRFNELGQLNDDANHESVTPSLENLQGRGKILRNRVSNIVRYRLTEAAHDVREEIQRQIEELDEHSSSLSRSALAFQQAEMGLMEATGEFLFKDDEPAPDPDEEPQTPPES